MEDLYFYDFNFNILHILPKSKAVNYSLYYNKIGTAEIHMELSGKILKLLKEYEMFAVQGSVQWMVTGYKVNRYEIIIFGRTLNYLFSRRAVLPFATVNTDPESLVRQLVRDAYMTDKSSITLKDGRVIPVADADGNNYTLKKQDNFMLADKVGEEFKASTYRRDTGQALSDCVSDYLDCIRCGHDITADIKNKQWVFKIFKGDNHEMLLSEQNRNCTDTEKTVEKQDYYNCGFFEKTSSDEGSEGEDPEVDSDVASDWFFVPGTGTNTDIPLLRFEAVLSGTTNSEAKQSFATKKVKENVTITLKKLKFGKDYRLGDRFRVNCIFDGVSETQTVYVSGINISFENDVYNEVPKLEVYEDD